MSEIELAMTPEEWTVKALRWEENVKYIGCEEADFDLLLGPPLHLTTQAMTCGVERPHAVAALALYRQPFGFTRADVAALRKCADNAERWASTRMYDPVDHACCNIARSVSERIAALLPPEENG